MVCSEASKLLELALFMRMDVLQGRCLCCAQVNWQMLWVGKRKRAGLRLAGWILLTVVIIFPIGIFTGENSPIVGAPHDVLHTKVVQHLQGHLLTHDLQAPNPTQGVELLDVLGRAF